MFAADACARRLGSSPMISDRTADQAKGADRVDFQWRPPAADASAPDAKAGHPAAIERHLIEEEVSKSRAELERLKAQNDRLEKDVAAFRQTEEDPPQDSVKATFKAPTGVGRGARASLPESSSDIPSLPPLHDKHAMAKTGKRFYKRAMVTSMAPWQRPPSRGALKETARQHAKSKYIRNTSMLYYKSGEELGLETAGDKGAPTLNYDGKMLFPMNPRHPKANRQTQETTSVQRAAVCM